MTDRNANTQFFRILAIDGGGIRGVYAAYLLARMEAEWSIDWTKAFHLIAGTSTGSIIAAGLASGMKANALLALYRDRSAEIFRRRPFCRLGLLSSRYRNSGLRRVLCELFGDNTLGEISTPLIIPATDIGNGCVHVLKSAYDHEFVRDKNVRIRDAVLASCSAPTYFDPCRLDIYSLADGGLWANNPALVAAIDAKRRLGIPLERMRILSVGTGTSRQFYPLKSNLMRRLFGWGIASGWQGPRFVSMLLNLQAATASNMLGLLLDINQILRLTFESDHVLSLDAPSCIPDLISKADRDFTHKAAQIKAFIKEVLEDHHAI